MLLSAVLQVSVAALAVTTALSAQQVWRVHPVGGTNVHFSDLPQAVAGASAGDTIVLLWDSQIPVNFRYSANVTIDKPLRITSASPFGTPGYSDPLSVPLVGQFTVSGIGFGELLALSNLSVSARDVVSTPVAPHGFDCRDCQGTLLFEDIWYAGGGLTNSVLNFERCASVTLRGCTFDLSGEPVTAIDSDLSITTSLIDWTGQYWWIPAANRWTNTGPGLVVRNSHVAILGSIVEGADRIASTPGLYAGVGARVESGSLDVGPYSTLAGGLAFGSRYGSYSMPSPTAGTITVDPRAAPLVHPTATPWSVPGEIPATYHDWLVAGETYHVSVVGPNNGWAMLVVGGLAPTPVTVPGLGASPMDLASATVMGLRLLDSNGWTEWTRQCPVNVPVALPFVFQAAVLAPTGSMALTYPSPFTVAWPHGYIP